MKISLVATATIKSVSLRDFFACCNVSSHNGWQKAHAIPQRNEPVNTSRRILLRVTASCLCFIQVGVGTAFAAQNEAQTVDTPNAATAATTPANAPIPTQIATAHSVFLSNLGADANFPIDSTSVYNAVYNDLQAWGRYQLVGSPEQADLVLQLHDLSTYTTYTGNHGSTYTINNPSFQLAIVDAKSNVTLWTISSPVYVTGSKQVLARWQALSETNLISRLKVLTGQQLSDTETADLTAVPKGHGKEVLFGALGVTAVLGVGMYFLVQHELSKMKDSQDAFCEANNIPLNECAGG